jgi:hypothetical protein
MNTRNLITSILAGATLCGLGAIAQPANPGPDNGPGDSAPARPRMSFAAFDLNGDGSVSEDEFNKARSEFRGGPGPGGGLGRGPGQRGPGRPGGDVELPREARPETGPVNPPAAVESKERVAESLEQPEGAPRRERARDGQGPQMRERRRDGSMGRPDGERPGMRRQADLSDRPGRGNREGGEFRRGPGPGPDRRDGQGRGPAGFRGGDRRHMAAGPGSRADGMAGGDRRPARDGNGPHFGERGGSNAAGVCPNCGCQSGPRDGGPRHPGHGRGQRRMPPRG